MRAARRAPLDDAAPGLTTASATKETKRELISDLLHVARRLQRMVDSKATYDGSAASSPKTRRKASDSLGIEPLARAGWRGRTPPPSPPQRAARNARAYRTPSTRPRLAPTPHGLPRFRCCQSRHRTLSTAEREAVRQGGRRPYPPGGKEAAQRNTQVMSENDAESFTNPLARRRRSWSVSALLSRRPPRSRRRGGDPRSERRTRRPEGCHPTLVGAEPPFDSLCAVAASTQGRGLSL
jgi:hypothetical protein